MSTVTARCLLGVAVVGLPLLAGGALRVENRTDDMRQWLPKGRAELERYDWFAEQFGADDFIIVSWVGCTLEDPRLEQFATAALREADERRQRGEPPIVRRVLTGTRLVEQLTSKPISLPRTAAERRLRGLVVGQQQGVAAAVVEFSDLATIRAAESIDFVRRIAKQHGRIDPEDLRLGGGVYEAAFIDDQSRRDFEHLVLPAGLVGLLVAIASFRSWRLTLVVLGIAAYCALMSIALVYFGGGKLNAVLIVLPILVFVLVVSGGVHLANYYCEAAATRNRGDAARHALRVGWAPCVLASGSTAIGLFSLLVSQIEPVRAFGWYTGAALLVAIVVLLGLFPAALIGIGPGKTEPGAASAHTRPRSRSPFQRWLDRWAVRIVRRHASVSSFSLWLFIGLGAGLFATSASVKIERMFQPDSQLLENYRWLETQLGPLAGMEVIVTLPSEAPDDMLARAQFVARVHSQLARVESIGATLSAVSFMPSLSNRGGLRATARRAILRGELVRLTPQLEEDGMLAHSEEGQHWRISARLPALGDFEYQPVADEARERIEKVIAADANFSAASITFTGASPLIDVAQQQLLDDLVSSFLLAFVLVCPIMMLILRAFGAGLVAMIPNVLPVAMVFGGMGWAGTPIDIGVVLTCSVALGIAVDDTLHFLTWFRRRVAAGRSRSHAIIYAHRQCAKAMIQTTLICGLTMLVLAFSSFVPTSRFAILLALLLVAALFGDLVLLPAMLAGPAGRLFVPTRPRTVQP